MYADQIIKNKAKSYAVKGYLNVEPAKQSGAKRQPWNWRAAEPCHGAVKNSCG